MSSLLSDYNNPSFSICTQLFADRQQLKNMQYVSQQTGKLQYFIVHSSCSKVNVRLIQMPAKLFCINFGAEILFITKSVSHNECGDEI